MSKTEGNVVNPDEYIDEWGADAFRTYLMFLGPFEEGGDFRDAGISGVKRFLDRLWMSVHDARTRRRARSRRSMRKLHQTIKKVGEDIPRLSYNTAIAAMMEYMNALRARRAHAASSTRCEPLVQLVAPFAPHIAEELWERARRHGAASSTRGWPSYDAALRRGGHRDDRRAGERQDARDDQRVEDGVTGRGAWPRRLAEPNVAKFVTGAVKQVIFVPGRMLNVLV